MGSILQNLRYKVLKAAWPGQLHDALQSEIDHILKCANLSNEIAKRNVDCMYGFEVGKDQLVLTTKA